MLPKLYFKICLGIGCWAQRGEYTKIVKGSATELLANKTKDWEIGADSGEHGIQRLPAPYHAPRSRKTNTAETSFPTLSSSHGNTKDYIVCFGGGYIGDSPFFPSPKLDKTYNSRNVYTPNP